MQLASKMAEMMIALRMDRGPWLFNDCRSLVTFSAAPVRSCRLQIRKLSPGSALRNQKQRNSRAKIPAFSFNPVYQARSIKRAVTTFANSGDHHASIAGA
jgi:hypothetical protein